MGLPCSSYGKESASSAGDTACNAYGYLNHFVVYLKLHNTVTLQHKIKIKKALPFSRSSRFSPMLSSMSFIVFNLFLVLWSILSAFLCVLWGKDPTLFFVMRTSCLSNHLSKRLFFSPYWIILTPLLKVIPSVGFLCKHHIVSSAVAL